MGRIQYRKKLSELSKEEVNVYIEHCGVTRYECVTDQALRENS